MAKPRINKRILADGRSNPRLGRPNNVTYDRGLGFTSSAQAQRELIAGLEGREGEGTITESERKLLGVLRKNRPA